MSHITTDAYEGDLVSRLRAWRGLHLAHGGGLFEEAANEIERLRSLVRFQDNVIRSGDTAVLTTAEREAVETCITDDDAMTHHSRASTLRGLLDRLT